MLSRNVASGIWRYFEHYKNVQMNKILIFKKNVNIVLENWLGLATLHIPNTCVLKEFVTDRLMLLSESLVIIVPISVVYENIILIGNSMTLVYYRELFILLKVN